MKRVALTGGIATGKSRVLDRCRQLGIACIDADALARGVLVPGTEATAAVVERFGAGMLDQSGEIDRHKLGSVVFEDDAARRDLEAIVHPAVYRAIAAGLRGFELLGDVPLAIVDIPLLYETGRAGDFQMVIATTCAPETQRTRLAQRGLNPVEIERRLSAQLPAADKAARADYVITTDGSFEETNRQLDQILQQIQSS